MKTLLPAGLLLATIAWSACGAPEPAPSTPPPPAGAAETAYVVDTSASVMHWSGTMIGVVSHSGTLKFTSGSFGTKDGQLVEGAFTANMKSLTPTDSSYAPPGAPQGTRAMILGHLSSSAFFAVDSFPTTTFKVTSVSGNTATGNLTVRGKTFPEQVTDIVIHQDSTGVMATGNLSFDRQKYGVAWESTMKDMVLSDQIDVKVELHGVAK